MGMAKHRIVYFL